MWVCMQTYAGCPLSSFVLPAVGLNQRDITWYSHFLRPVYVSIGSFSHDPAYMSHQAATEQS